MGKTHRPHHGSKQFWPRRRVKKFTPRVRSWVSAKGGEFLGFAGYKAGMSHILFKDARANSITKGDLVNYPATIIECPPLKVFSISFYISTAYGTQLHSRIVSKNIDKILAKKISLPKKEVKGKDIPEQISEIRLGVHTQPGKTGIGKKKPEIFEIPYGDLSSLEKAKELLGKEISLSEVFKAGDMVDVHAATKGKGFQGTVKRFGVALREKKSEKKRRAVVLAPQTPGKILWGMLLPGQLGTHLRTEYNKEVLLVEKDASKINPDGGFLRYGNVKNDYIVLKGSIPGPKKRLITLTKPIRGTKSKQALNLETISTRSQQ